ncbi:hypothetical protein [Nocardia sp. NPDC005745]|uniref:hypothetical protein n=1 Tax=Nocardia sp. NPDC005745 TaxID=3157061 RepID=UPI0033E04FF3
MTSECRSPVCAAGRLAPIALITVGVLNIPIEFGLVTIPTWVAVVMLSIIIAGVVTFAGHWRLCNHCYGPLPVDGPTDGSRAWGLRTHGLAWRVLRVGFFSVIAAIVVALMDKFVTVSLDWITAAFLSVAVLSVGVEMAVSVLHRCSWCPICHPDDKRDNRPTAANDVEWPGTI